MAGDAFDQTNTPRAKGGVPCVLLDPRFRLFVRVAADADFSAQRRGEGGVLHSRRAEVQRNGDSVDRRKRDVRVPPARPDPHWFPNVARTAFASGQLGFALAVPGG